MRTFRQDLRFALRILAKNPGFAVVAVATLGLGIGANTAIFSVVDAVMLRPLPYPDSDQLVWLSERGPNFPSMSISYPNYLDWREQQGVFEHIGVYNWGSYNLTGSGEPLRLNGARISADAFAALRARAAVGRLFTADEDRPGGPPVVVLSAGLWQSRFASLPATLGQSITLDGRPHTIIGVMPAGFTFPSRVDVWLPVGPLSQEETWQNRGNHPGLLGVARLNSGVGLEQARRAMNAIAERLDEKYPDSNKNIRVRVDPLLENYVGNVRAAMWMLLGAVGFVLLIACANVANLMLARSAVRQKEMAVRAAVGAGRARIVRQMLTESLVLSLVGGGLGLLLAYGGVSLIVGMMGDAIPRASEVRIDGGVLLFTFVVSTLTGLLFGLAPAWQAGRADVHGTLKETARNTTGGRARLRQGLVVAEVALTLLLLTGAGLLLRSFHRLQQVNPGFSHQGVLSFRLDLPQQRYDSDAKQVRFFEDLIQGLRGVPGVQAVGIASQIPLDQEGWQTSFLIDGRPAPPIGERPSMEVTVASPDYFHVMGISLLRGRCFTEADNRDHLQSQSLTNLSEGQRWAAGLKVVMIDEEFARQYWPNEDPIGHRVRLPWADNANLQPLLTVIGVVGRVRLNQLNEPGGFVQAYLPAAQAPGRGRAVVLKTLGAPESLVSAVRARVHALDPDQPIYGIRTLSELRDQSLAPQRVNLTLLVIFSVAALALAVIGLYGVLAYNVTQRQREIGVRMALGARHEDVMGLVVGHGMRMAMVGVGLGLFAAVALTHLLRTLLYEVGPFDPPTFLGVTAVLPAVALIACWVPARRAARVPPMVALRYE